MGIAFFLGRFLTAHSVGIRWLCRVCLGKSGGPPEPANGVRSCWCLHPWKSAASISALGLGLANGFGSKSEADDSDCSCASHERADSVMVWWLSGQASAEFTPIHRSPVASMTL
jgi:hypothetical protein